MSSPAHPIVIYDEDRTFESEDAFLGFVNHARSVLSSEESIDSDREEDNRQPSWSWIVSRILKTCIAYSSGVTAAILLSDLFQLPIRNDCIRGNLGVAPIEDGWKVHMALPIADAANGSDMRFTFVGGRGMAMVRMGMWFTRNNNTC